MELAEVVNPHFAVPVVGVVLCAVLVFAFGFKSPVQPPSFDFDDHEDRKNKRQRKAKQKTPSNGHVVNVDNHVTTVNKQLANPKQSPGAKVVAEKNEPPLKLKVKKTGGTPKSNLKPATSPEVPQPKEEDDGGWTEAVTRKHKKRGKKDDGPVTAKVESKKEEAVLVATESNVVEVVAKTPEPTPPEPAKAQRNKKEKKQKETPLVVEKVEESPPGDQSDKENTPEVEVIPQETAVPIPQVDTTDKNIKASPKKKKNKKTKPALEQELNKDASEVEPLLAGGAQAPADEIKSVADETSDVKEAPEKSDISKPAATPAQTAPTDTNTKPARSPKKKKKNKSPEPNVSETAAASNVAEPVAASSSLLDQGAKSSVESLSHPSSKGAAKDRLSEPVSDSNPAPSSAASSSPQISTEEDKESTEKVSFDELGEWQEAKPVKKKKKARRDN